MGSKRFYEHAQNPLGGMKKEVDNYRTQGKKGCYIVKSITLCNDSIISYYNIMLCYSYIV